MADLPTILTPAGLQPQSLLALRLAILQLVTATNPGYTGDLPGSLIEDMLSTDAVSLSLIDQARVEILNSISPNFANPFMLNQLGQMYGVTLGQSSNTSVLLQFAAPGRPGYTIAQGFIVSDGTHQYQVQSGGIIGADEVSPQLFALATAAGTWVVPPDTVTQLVTSVPDGVTLTVTNPQAGVPGTDTETQTSYRARVMQAGLAASQGMTRYLRTLLDQVDGVQSRLIDAQPRTNGGWIIIVGGGDIYQVANAIWTALFDISTIFGSELFATDITAALPGEVTTELNHGFTAGDAIQINDADPNDYNADDIAVLAVIDEKTFTLGKPYAAQNIDSISWDAGGGGKVTATFVSDHGVTVGTTFVLVGNTPAGYNGTFVAIAGTSSTDLVYAEPSDPGSSSVLGQLSAGIALYDTSGFGSYVASTGIITPNLRNVVVTIQDYPDPYQITFVNPPQQIVTMTVTWNTNSPNFVAPAAVAQLGAQPLADYVNSIYVGRPLNLFQMQTIFQEAIASVLAPSNLTRLVFAVAINGVGTSPDMGTGIIEGDAQSYLFSTVTDITIVQG